MKSNRLRFSAVVSQERLDKLLVDAGIAQSRTQAQRLIAAGAVQAKLKGQWIKLHKPSQKLPAATELITEQIDELQYVSRAGLKLAHALEHLMSTGEIHNQDLLDCPNALDIGQSTGGFTDCLLQRGVESVVGVDVGRDQLVETIRNDKRVVCLEGINARDLPASLLDYAPSGFNWIVMDVSFISQTLILPSLVKLLHPQGRVLALVKPQFEVGKEGIAKGGLVKDESLFGEVENKIKHAYKNAGLIVKDYFPSALPGSDGNREFFVFV